MIRKIIHIDEEKCNGCSACASACHEGAIEMVDGKARLTRKDYCGGLEFYVKEALQVSGKSIPCKVATASAGGSIL